MARWHQIVAAIILVACIACIGYFSYKYSQQNQVLKHGHYGVIIDAGGTGSRLYVYEYRSEDDIRNIFSKKCEKQGLTQYSNITELRPLLIQCLHDAEAEIPKDIIKSTPLFMKATAGMRKLKLQDGTKYKNVWSEVRKILSDGNFPVSTVGTIPGKDEATYSWTTVNKVFPSKESNGIIEIGSTSLQIAFAPASGTNLPAAYSSEVDINGGNYKIYATSYLCLGKEEFMRRYYAELVRDANYSTTVDNPCGNKGYELNLTEQYLWEKQPCISGAFANSFLGQSIPSDPSSGKLYTMKGSGDYTQCQNNVQKLFDIKKCNQTSCGMFDVFQPQIHGKFIAIGGAAYYASKFLNLPNDFNLTTFQQHLKALCESNVQQVEQREGFGKYSFTYCLSNSLTNHVLQNVVQVDTTIPGNFMFTNKKTSWTLGSIIKDKDQLSAALYETVRGMSEKSYIILMVIMGVFLVVVIAYFVVSCKKRDVYDPV
ncbi:ectonucleoside triphosphate diphosphohydrolase 3-like [Clytia hemisphaerica]|uniref:Ectonucleoside triphosphate diphosphohydrolase n=1 Tax=Clytia hemisphaerica TaxID=252671 RepID=A0A7M5WUL4_9CNID|eukprot:TCONS_00011592-protein